MDLVDNLPVHVFTKHMITSLSLDELLLPRYVKWSSNFSRLPSNVNMTSQGGNRLYHHVPIIGGDMNAHTYI